MKKLRTLDLFAGIGGFSLGLEKTGGFSTIAFCEIDKDCQEILNKHWPDVPIHDDIKTLNFTEPVDVITAGFPCVDISVAGKKKGISAPRSGLWKECFRLIKELKPKYVIIENVANLRKNGLGVVLNDLASCGRNAEWAVIPAYSVGLPHQRERLFLISNPNSERCDSFQDSQGEIHINEEWQNPDLEKEGSECISKPFEIRPILSKGAFDYYRASCPYRFASVSKICRIVNGPTSKLHEKERKIRIKQLGNSIIPDIAEIIGQAIIDHHLKSK